MHDWTALKEKIRGWGRKLGFTAVGFAGIDLGAAEAGLVEWLAAGSHGTMDYMARHGVKRARPGELVPGTRCVISCRMDYLPAPPFRECRPASADSPKQGGARRDASFPASADSPKQGGARRDAPFPASADFRDAPQAVISRYALGRDYHKVVRSRLQRLAERIEAETGPINHRAFTDSAPVMEVELAKNAGLGWRGKHTLLLSRSGSWFFLGELFVDLPLPPDGPIADHCGRCTACLTACPTGAFLGPYRLDARRCISYLTIEHAGSIAAELRPLLGNRIYGCDDCQLVCPWNRHAPTTREADFLPRHGLDRATLVELFAWSESEFNERLAGSPIRRIGHERWLRNIAIALGNAAPDPAAKAALLARADHPSALVREHVAWALSRYPG
ncbi:MAG: tRNA epoxyqueuosine(34) reductase QueG [Rhodocyclaceae bacterium]|nr:tRNA epoxyqueuosine(34) reductase QueG [Rhodocyclaceae bacterium]